MDAVTLALFWAAVLLLLALMGALADRLEGRR